MRSFRSIALVAELGDPLEHQVRRRLLLLEPAEAHVETAKQGELALSGLAQVARTEHEPLGRPIELRHAVIKEEHVSDSR